MPDISSLSSDIQPGQKTILIVDDTPVNLRLLANLLTGEGYATRLSPNGSLALNAIRKELPDLILLDIRMPHMDGYEVCEQLKADERTREIPIVFLSALQDEKDKVKAFELGGADYISKPFQTQEVIARVRHQLQLVDLRQQLQLQNQQLRQEIDRRQAVQTELNQERILLRSLLDTIPDLIFYKDLQGRYILWNQAFEKLAGLPTQAIFKRTDADLFSPKAAQWIHNQDQQVLQTGQSLRYEEWATFPDQARRLLDTYKVPIHGATGDRLGLIGICRDLTTRKAAEDHLNRTTSRLSTLIQNLQAGILVENEHREIVLVNQAFCEIFGIPTAPQDLLGADCSQLVNQSAAIFTQPQTALQRINDILRQQQPAIAEECVLVDGQILERDYVPIRSSDRFQGHLWQYRNVTLSKANEKALRSTTQTLEEFSNNLKQLHRLSLKQFTTFDELFDDYLATGCQVMQFPHGLVSSISQETFTVRASTGELLQAGFSCNLTDTLCSEAVSSQSTITHQHLGGIIQMRHHPAYKIFKIESCIATPIFVNGQIYGSLCFFSQEIRQEGFASHEREIIELMAQSIGKFIRSYQVEQQRQQAETALRESEARFRQLAEHIENVFWIFEPSQQRFTYISPAYETIWGQSCQSVYQNPQGWQTTIHPKDVERVVAKWGEDEGYDEEYRIIRPDGTLRWIRDRSFPILNQADQVTRVVGIAEDISDIKNQEQALRLIFEGTAAKTGEAFFQSLVRYLANVLQVRYALITQKLIDDQTRLRTLAFWQEDHFNNNEDIDCVGSPCEQVMAGQIVFHPENLQVIYPNNENFIAWGANSYLGVPLRDNNHIVIGHLAVLDDRPMLPDKPRELILRIFAARAGAELERQTFEHEIQQARELADAANTAKSKFLANISHELRTPLNTILGFTQLLLDKNNTHAINGQARDHLQIVNRSGEHLLTLINDVLEMSKIEAGKVSVHTRAFDLHGLLQTVEDMFSLRAKAKNLTLQVECGVAVPRYIETDEIKLRQILINLLSNAVKFTTSGFVILRVQVLSSPNPQAEATTATILSQLPPTLLLFEVQDTGPGIASTELETLFDPFVQTTVGRSAQEGTGLGLPISQRFAHLLEGEIQVQTQPGQGTCFALKIEVQPAIAPQQSTTEASLPQIQRLAAGQPDYRILVVEDHLENRLLLVNILESVGFQVYTAADGIAAVEQAKACRPHLIWMDIRMPRMNGYTAIHQIKAAKLSPSPVIIVLTASAFEEERNRAMKAGCEDFVRKPFKANQILQKIAEYLPVHYVYAAPSDVPENAALIHTDNHPSNIVDQAAALKSLPPTWLKALQQAAIKGSDKHILQLVQSLPPEQSELAQALTNWAQAFQFDVILTLLQT